MEPQQDHPHEQPTQEGADLRQPFSWEAPEGLHVHRTAGWYAAFWLVTIGLIALALFVFKSYTFAVLIPVMAVAVMVFGTKPPRMVHYSISPKGVYVGDTLHDFSQFRAFGVIMDEQLPSVVLLPVRRFSPGLTLYFTAADGEKIVDMLGARLPMQQIAPDALDKFIRMIRL